MLKKCFSNKKFVVGFIILVPLIIVMIFGNFLVPNDPYALDTVNMLKNSSAKYPLGTDEYGRCILTRLILGIRPSMMVALGGTAISFAGGTLLGVAAGYLEGRIGAVIMRGIDIIVCFPPILLAMIIAGLWGAGVINLMLVIGILYIPHFSRVAYSSTLQVRKMEYVESDVGYYVEGYFPEHHIGSDCSGEYHNLKRDSAGIGTQLPGAGRSAAYTVLGADDWLGKGISECQRHVFVLAGCLPVPDDSGG